MPCWYFERKEIKNSPSCRDGIDSNTENRYRREGARFILDAGTKLGLRYDTCATGVVYFHRFYMMHSFKEFYRYVTASCCLFLAGKVEETPKKCRDIIKTSQALLSSTSFQRFGEDPREEVMMMERVLLKTIKFDLQIEHPYGILIKYLKYFKGEKDKTQKMAQMAWTFINDSLCTTLSLQWEPEIIAVSLMYLASRLTKFDPNDWSGRSSSRSKWWEDFVEGMSMELMEDICHQVLDLYSKQAQKKAVEESPPQSPAKSSRNQESPPPPPPPDKGPGKRSREMTPSEAERDKKALKQEKQANTPSKSSSVNSATTGAPIPVAQHIGSKSGSHSSYPNMDGPSSDFNSLNPYVSSSMFSSSFMSQEGSQNIQSILAGTSAPPPTNIPAYPDPHHPLPAGAPEQQPYPPQVAPEVNSYSYPPPSQASYLPRPSIPPPHAYPPPNVNNAPPPQYDPYGAPPNQQNYPPHSYPPPGSQPPPQQNYPPPNAPPQQFGGYPPQYPPVSQAQGPPPPMMHQGPPGMGPPPRGSNFPPPGGAYGSQPPPNPQQNPNYGPPRHGHRGNFNNKQGKHQRKDIPSLTEIKIGGRGPPHK